MRDGTLTSYDGIQQLFKDDEDNFCKRMITSPKMGELGIGALRDVESLQSSI
jgi:hypothetical protein